MISFIKKNEYCIGCRFRPVKYEFRPRLDDFNYLYFKIDGTVYFDWSTKFEHAILLERLKRDS